MAKPRIFVSSTFYDLRQVRENLFRFIKDLGYDPVLNEFGQIPYGKDEKLEEYCYKEISNVDILISIVGGRYGSDSQHGSQSISQLEVRTALELNKQVYIFIDKNVKSEYQTFLFNKESENIKYRFVDDRKIYEFIEFLENLPNNNNILGFETTQDIIGYLREQWAGLFQRFLKEQTRIKEINVLKSIETTAKTLNTLVTFISEERKDRDTAIQDILLSNHPAMEELRQILSVTYRVYFTTLDEMTEWLSARNFKRSQADFLFEEDYYEFEKLNIKANKKNSLKIKKELFHQDGRLKAYTKADWNNEYIQMFEINIKKGNDEDLPF